MATKHKFEIERVYTPIIQLSQLVANQIAAGEVVERPSSVVKELIENSLDAGSTKIEVEIEGGGTHLIRVRDNGCGMKKADLMLAFARHATSKIRTTEDLAAIASLGFRGEALASISSVSRCRLTSKSQDEECAWQVQLSNDLAPNLFPVAHPAGTTVEVADLFYNTPVRRKFLRSEKTEFQAIEEVLKRLSLAFPQVSFSLKHQQRQVRFYPRAGADESFRVAKICGQSFMNQAIEIAMNAAGLSLRGWLGLPAIARRQADCQYFFVNQRMVKDRFLNHVIKTIYQQHPHMPEATYPCYVLYLTLDPSEVDVNVHPTKQEVRFSQARLIHDFMSKAIKDALEKANSESISSQGSSLEDIAACNTMQDDSDISSTFAYYQHGNDNPKSNGFNSNDFAFRQDADILNDAVDSIVNQPRNETCNVESTQKRVFPSTAFFHRYACIENGKGVFIVDLTSAKASLLTYYFEKHWQNIATKSVLFPLRLSLPMKSALLQEAIANLAAIGFHLRLENQEITLLTQPEILKSGIDKELLKELIQQSVNKKHHEWLLRLGESLADLFDNITSPAFHDLLTEWIASKKQGAWCYFSDEQLTKEMKNNHHVESEMV